MPVALLVAAVCLVSACSASESAESPRAAEENLLMPGAKQSECVSTERVSVLANETGPVRSDVYSITFLDSLADAPDDTWDVSDAGDGSVMAWFEDSEEKWMYDLYIAGENGVNANPDSFDTSSVTKMYFMFSDCSSLKSLDVSGFDTSSVTDMSDMFSGCSSLKSLDVGSFDTSSVTDLSYMFADCTSLKSLNISSFDLTGADTTGMFDGTDLEEHLNQVWTAGRIAVVSFNCFRGLTSFWRSDTL